MKPTAIPRLELCGTLLLACLYREICDTLNVCNKIIFWCDSTVVLNWLKTSPHLLKTFVANRVVEIQDLSNSNEWRHVRSEDNPADAISRGQLPHAFLQNAVIWTSIVNPRRRRMAHRGHTNNQSARAKEKRVFDDYQQ